jgi:PHD/YefM family antitoxin component YafN of YafNO toxin-antitoxin module
MSETLPSSEVKAHLAEVDDSADDLASLEETLDILQDEELMDSLRTSRRRAAAGDTVPLRDQV